MFDWRSSRNLAKVASVAVVATCSYKLGRYAISLWLSNSCDGDRRTLLSLKTAFQDVPLPELPAVDGHTHGESAAARSSGSLFADLVARVTGFTPVFLSGSGADKRAGREYTREYYWLKDLVAPAQWSVVERPLNVMIDVDYYPEMENFLGWTDKPWIFYTFVPSNVGRSKGDYSYTFTAAGTVLYSVSGGGEYEHQVWDWDGDSIGCVYRFLGMIPWKFTGYAIERRQVDEDHQLVLLAPLVHTRNPITTFVVRCLLSYRRLQRLIPNTGMFTRMLVNTSDGMYRCTGKPGCYSAAKVPVQVDDAIASTALTISGKLTLASVKSKMDPDFSGMKEFPGAEILLEYHLRACGGGPRVSVLDKAVRRFQYVPENATYDADAKAGMVAFMEPLLDGGFVPDVCRNNDQAFVNERIKKVRVTDLPIGKALLGFIDEFAERLIPVPGQSRPVEEEEVYKRQAKPSQRALLEQSQNERGVRMTNQFMKKEAYQNVNHPRGISQINSEDKRRYSAYIYAFVDDYLKKVHWYAFAKKPSEVALSVATICVVALYVMLTDFSRMDGRVSNVCRFVEKLLMLRAFPVWLHNEIIELLRSQHHLGARTANGVRHTTEWERLSGSAETSAFNTIINAIIMYVAYRLDGFGPDEAWDKLGIYGGDDGLAADITPENASKAARWFGQKLECIKITRGQLGVRFLARCYGPDVWTGDTSSCCDIPRQLAKLHLTVCLPPKVTRIQKLQEKAFAFSLTDSNTPVLGPFVRKVLELFPLRNFENAIGIWGVEMDRTVQYPNQNTDGWMDHLAVLDLPEFDFDKFKGWLQGCTGETIFNPPSFAPEVPPNSKPGRVVVDGDVLGENDGDKGGIAAAFKTDVMAKAKHRPRKQRPDSHRKNHGSRPVEKRGRNITVRDGKPMKTE